MLCLSCRDQFRFLLSPLASDLHHIFTQQLKWKALEPRSEQQDLSDPAPSSSSSSLQEGVLSEGQVFLPGAGLVKRLYKERCVRVHVHVRVCVHVCVRVCVHVCARVCACVWWWL